MHTASSSNAVGDEAAATDAALATSAASGDTQAFERIMRRHNQRLFRLAVGVIADTTEAEDVLQESYVKAFYRLADYSGSGSLGAWLGRIVRNEAIDRLRSRASRRNHIAYEAELEDPLDEGASMLDRARSAQRYEPPVVAETAQLKGVLEHAIARLPEQFRAAFVLREVEGLSVEEAAEYLDVPAATVKTRDHRARGLLRGYLSETIDTSMAATFTFGSSHCDALVAAVLTRIRAGFPS